MTTFCSVTVDVKEMLNALISIFFYLQITACGLAVLSWCSGFSMTKCENHVPNEMESA